jgi:hypothetical protein
MKKKYSFKNTFGDSSISFLEKKQALINKQEIEESLVIHQFFKINCMLCCRFI